ncbi:Ger(x)C family spore germination protein [Paenibacillus sp. ATY16]|uniref:Ger(x)C family spore germination protein n=1 Tax=Paenibacillus sp. ATY16 TaxID=1759312 RepID=UPI00200F355A|nr:Ger(x)C family spore germination protein [Paenibacillus sp. ATY16]MCK9861138.1 Ger(x)C family spore germination protein [Paenibacillus sp. ATY16]
MKLRIVIGLFLVIMLGGCWDNKDINHRALPIAMGISYQQGNYEVFLDIPKVTEKNEGIQIISAKGNSISAAVNKISMNLEDQVDLLHLKVLIVDKAFATQGLNEITASTIRSRHISPKTMFVICDEPLDRFFKGINNINNGDGKEIYDFFQKNSGWNPEIAHTPVWKVFRSIHSYTNDVVLPIIKSGESTAIQSMGSGILKNGKMVGRLNNEQTLLYNVYDGNSLDGKIEVIGKATVQIVSSRIHNESKFVSGKPVLNSELKLKVIILDVIGNPTVDVIKTELQILLQRVMDQIFRKVQLANADIFGIGQHYRDDLPRTELAQWRTKYLPEAKINLEVKTTIRNTGNLKLH